MRNFRSNISTIVISASVASKSIVLQVWSPIIVFAQDRTCGSLQKIVIALPYRTTTSRHCFSTCPSRVVGDSSFVSDDSPNIRRHTARAQSGWVESRVYIISAANHRRRRRRLGIATRTLARAARRRQTRLFPSRSRTGSKSTGTRSLLNSTRISRVRSHIPTRLVYAQNLCSHTRTKRLHHGLSQNLHAYTHARFTRTQLCTELSRVHARKYNRYTYVRYSRVDRGRN